MRYEQLFRRIVAEELVHLHHEMRKIMATLDALTAAVTNENTVIDSAITLLTEISAQLSAAATDPAAVQALADEINAKAQTLADAITANTPASEPPAA